MPTNASVAASGFLSDYHLIEDLSVTRLLYLAQQAIDFETVYFAGLSDEAMDVLETLHIPRSTMRCTLEGMSSSPLEETYCQFVYRSGQPLIVPDARHTPPFANLPSTDASNIGSYVGVPLITSDGTIFGSLCGLHPTPKTLTSHQIVMLQIVGKALTQQIERESLIAHLQADARHANETDDETMTLPDRVAFEYALHLAILQAVKAARPLSLIMAQPPRDELAATSQAFMQRSHLSFSYDDVTLATLLPQTPPDEAGQWAAGLATPCETSIGIAAYPSLASSQQLLVARAREALAFARNHRATSSIWIWSATPNANVFPTMKTAMGED